MAFFVIRSDIQIIAAMVGLGVGLALLALAEILQRAEETLRRLATLNDAQEDHQ